MNAIEMIRRCAKGQPHNPSYGTAAREGERTSQATRTDWGVGHRTGDETHIYPAMCLKEETYEAAEPARGFTALEYSAIGYVPASIMWPSLTPEQQARLDALFRQQAELMLVPRTLHVGLDFVADGTSIIYTER